MKDKHSYNPLKAILCRFFNHRWMAYDFGIDKCLRCNKEKPHAASSLERLGMTRCALCGMVVCSCEGRD